MPQFTMGVRLGESSAQQDKIESFIAHWQGVAGGAERSNLAPFIFQLSAALDLPADFAPSEKGRLGEYQFEAPVPHGSYRSLKASGAIDLYRRGRFMLEAKQSYIPQSHRARPELYDISPAGPRYDRLMREARLQAENYARNLPGGEPSVPFLIVCDIGRGFEIYFDFAGNGRGYDAFPEARRHRIELSDLRVPEIRERLRAIWTDPAAIDPRLERAEVTRDISGRLADVSRWLEAQQRPKVAHLTAAEQSLAVEETALFMMRLLFCMFAEEEGVGLLPAGKFQAFLDQSVEDDTEFERGLQDLWAQMDSPHGDRWSWAVRERVRYFNGRLFENRATYSLGRRERSELLQAAGRDWRKVEPAIFGTLLERALNWKERAKLGAHYTPRAYVERLVDATIMEVLRAEWESVQREIALSPEGEGRARASGGGDSPPAAEPPHPNPLPPGERGLSLVRAFHEKLAATRVLDPACGTGNFLYVAMEAMARLEAEVIETIRALGASAEPLVGPGQFHGLEKNPRAAKISELVLWIGWLRLRMQDAPQTVTDPVLARGAHINFGLHGEYDALLRRTEAGAPDLDDPQPAEWPEAEFIVGNPPFIGGKDIRAELGGHYAEALWKANPRVPASADLVMQWWERAANILTATGSKLRRFGFVTTNSITQAFSRRVIAQNLSPPSGEGGGLSLVMAIPDHPWVKAPPEAKAEKRRGRGKDRLLAHDEAQGRFFEAGEEEQAKTGPAAVRIAMTVAEVGTKDGLLMEVASEAGVDTDAPKIEFAETPGRINADLSVGPDATTAVPLLGNKGLGHDGVKLHGQGFSISSADAAALGLNRREGLESYIRPYRNGRDLTGRNPQESKDKLGIDLFGLVEDEVRRRFPEVYEHLLKTVKPERDKNRRATYRDKWWIFGEPRRELRPSLQGLKRFIATVDTAKHRAFQFLPDHWICDDKSVVVASNDAFHLGVLSSRVHLFWALKAGGLLESRPVYVKSRVFDPFPFPDATPDQRAEIARLGEALDETRKAALAETAGLTMTEIYNWVARVEGSFPVPPTALADAAARLTEAEEARASTARARTIAHLHRQIDLAVAQAYGWEETLAPAEIVARIVALNGARAAEEAGGQVRWLRADYQEPRFGG